MYFDAASAALTVAAYMGDEWVERHKIQAIKLVRGLTNLGLKESKDAVEGHITRTRSWYASEVSATAAPMSTKINRLKALQQIRSSISELEGLVSNQVDVFAAEPRIGAVVQFNHQFNDRGKVYTYVAIRDENGIWHVTGNDEHMRWDEMQQKYRALRDASTFALLS